MKEELNLFKALSNETRLCIMVLLIESELCVCQLEWVLKLSQAKVSRHLTVLKNAGLVQDRRKGLWIFYSLAKPKNELERMVYKDLKKYFVKKHNAFRRDILSMGKCVVNPLGKLTTIRR